VKQVLSVAEQLGPLLQAARKSAGLSQTELGVRMGISQSRVSAMELDPGSINLAQLMALCSALGLEMLLQTKERARGGQTDEAGSKQEW